MRQGLHMLIAGLILTLVFTGCSGLPQVETTIHQNERGIVSLRTFADPTVKATHPMTLEPFILARALRGLYVKEEKAMLGGLIDGGAVKRPTFTDEQIVFLAPLLSTALAQATDEEQITFSLIDYVQSKKRHTKGVLYVSEPALHLILTQYQVSAERPTLLSRPSYSFSRPKRWTLGFSPDTGLLDEFNDVPIGNNSDGRMLKIAYNRVPSHSNSSSSNINSEHSDEKVANPDALAHENKSGAELKTLKEELKELQNSLSEQNRKLDRLEKRVNP